MPELEDQLQLHDAPHLPQRARATVGVGKDTNGRGIMPVLHPQTAITLCLEPGNLEVIIDYSIDNCTDSACTEPIKRFYTGSKNNDTHLLLNNPYYPCLMLVQRVCL